MINHSLLASNLRLIPLVWSQHIRKKTVIIAARTFGYDQEQSSPTQDNTIGEPIEKDGESGCESTWNPNLEKEPDKQQRKYLEVENEDEDIELIIDANRIPVLNRAIKKVVWPHVKFFNGDYELQEYKNCLLYTSPSPRDQRGSRMPSSA